MNRLDALPQIGETLETCKLCYQIVKLSGSGATGKQENGDRSLFKAFNGIRAQKLFHGIREYPRNRRICSIVDMRKGDDKDTDDVLMFESHKGPGNPDCDEVRTGTDTAMGYFHRAKTVIIPDSADKEGAELGSMSQGPHLTVCCGQIRFFPLKSNDYM